MFRLAVPLLVTAVASIDDDSVSLMQGMKPKEQKEDKSKAIANLMQSATNMLKNGATPDVVEFADRTLTEITDVVEVAIRDAHGADQTLIDNTFQQFEDALVELAAGNARVTAAHNAEIAESTSHKNCRKEEKGKCIAKQECDYDLWSKWQSFVQEESTMRDRSAQITGLFCPPDANGTTEQFRTSAVVFFDPWLEQKPIVERHEVLYDDKVPVCEEHFEDLDDKTAECDGFQAQLELAACTHANTAQEVKNTFSEAWMFAVYAYQRVSDEVHCLEIDRWKEWRTLKTVECLLVRTTERNGRPCDEATDEVVEEVAACEAVQSTEDISHIQIEYHVPPPVPCACGTPACGTPPSGRCIPNVPHAPCSSQYIVQEYGPDLYGLHDGNSWIPPQPEFTEHNSHCNPQAECAVCEVVPEVPQCQVTFAANPPQVEIPMPEHECSQATRDHLAAGSFNSNGHYTPQAVQGGQQD